jgi:hypothetical protein
MFVVITAPPLQDGTYATNARAFNQWLMNDWLDNYTLNNVFVFDFYNVLTGPEAHHRYNNGQVEHILGNQNTLYYDSNGDDHPSVQGSQKATAEFVPLLNIFYHRWKGEGDESVPSGTGIYDDIDLHWTYSGFTATTTTGPYRGTIHYSTVVGSMAEFPIDGSQITLTYSKYSNRGNLAVYVDDDPTPLTTINEYSATRVWQASWTSGNLGAGPHTIKLVHASGAAVDIDAIEVKTYVPPTPQGVGKYDDGDLHWTYNGFTATTTTGPYRGTIHYSTAVGSMAEFPIDGSQITLTYSKYSNRGNLAVYIDDNPTPLTTINEYNATRVWQASWTSGNLGAGPHTIKLVHASGATVDIDAIEVFP